MNTVLDASAVLAYVHREPGWKTVQTNIETACVSAVNWSEVMQKITQKGLNVELARDLLQQRGLEIIPFSATQAEIAAALWETTRKFGLSLADRAGLALALDQKLPVLTADRHWRGLNLEIEVQLLR